MQNSVPFKMIGGSMLPGSLPMRIQNGAYSYPHPQNPESSYNPAIYLGGQVLIQLDTYGDEGFCLRFGYNEDVIKRIRLCAGFAWNKVHKVWASEGPESILDLERNGIPYVPTLNAERRLASFRKRLQTILDMKAAPLPVGEFTYQPIGTSILLLQRRGILADDMGLGKTKQALDAVSHLITSDPNLWILILAPKSLIWNWMAEIRKWYPEWLAKIVPDAPKARKEFWESPPQIVIANYQKVLASDFPEKGWDVVIADEATAVKNTKAQTHKAVRRIVAETKYAFMLTGTPLEMRVEELYGIFSVVRPSVFGGWTRFQDQHVATDYSGKVVGPKNTHLLRERISPWLIRRTKAEVLTHLPPKVYNNVLVEMDAAETKDYMSIRNDFLQWCAKREQELQAKALDLPDTIEDRVDAMYSQVNTVNSANVLTQLLRLQQFTSSAKLLDYSYYGSKLMALAETLDGWSGNAVVFTRFAEMAQLLLASLQLPAEAIIHGQVKAQDRVTRVDRFNHGELGRVFISTDAGAYGLNITSADLIVHYDMLWNPAKMRQREDRAHRIGQHSVVNVVHLLNKGTLDEGMKLINNDRQDLFQDVVEGAAKLRLNITSLKKLTLGEIG